VASKKKALHVILGAIVAHIFRSFLRISGILLGFAEICPDFHGSFPDFHQINNFGAALAPRHLHEWCSI